MSTASFTDQRNEMDAVRSSRNYCGYCDDAHAGGVCPDPENPKNVKPETQTWEAEVRTGFVQTIKDRVFEANKRARRLKVPELTCGTVPGSEVTYWVNSMGARLKKDPGNPFFRPVDYVQVAISGTPAVLPGWSLLARLDLVYDAETKEALCTINKAPGAPEGLMDDLRQDSTCDHCGSKRQRKVVYAVQHEDGRRLQVGANCLMDFLGTDRSPEKHLNFWASVGSLADEESGFWGSMKRKHWELLELLPWVALAIRKEGWVSRSAAKMNDNAATVSVAQDEMSRPYTIGKEVFRPRWPEGVQEEDLDAVRAAIDWAKALQPRKDYEHTIHVIARAGYCPIKQDGFAASIVSAHQRALDRLREQELKKREEDGRFKIDPTAHVGTVGERREFSATFKRLHSFDGDFGTTHLYNFVDEETGALIVTFASSGIYAKAPEMEIGDVVKFKATVKKHDDYKGTAQTQVARLAWIKEK